MKTLFCILRLCLFNFLYIFNHKFSLAKRTWKKVTKRNKYFSIALKEKRKNFILRFLNGGNSSMLVVGIILLILFAACFISEDSTSKYFRWAQWIKFPSDEKAYSLINEMLGAAATIVGLSFVVIGLLIETIKNQTKINYTGIFRTARMYYGFAISIIGLLYLIFFNLFRYTVSIYVVGNLAILSTIILFSITISIGVIFYKFLSFLNPEIFTQIEKLELLNALEEEIIQEELSSNIK